MFCNWSSPITHNLSTHIILVFEYSWDIFGLLRKTGISRSGELCVCVRSLAAWARGSGSSDLLRQTVDRREPPAWSFELIEIQFIEGPRCQLILNGSPAKLTVIRNLTDTESGFCHHLEKLAKNRNWIFSHTVLIPDSWSQCHYDSYAATVYQTDNCPKDLLRRALSKFPVRLTVVRPSVDLSHSVLIRKSIRSTRVNLQAGSRSNTRRLERRNRFFGPPLLCGCYQENTSLCRCRVCKSTLWHRSQAFLHRFPALDLKVVVN